MKSFRTELEQESSDVGKALVEKDILELEQKIHEFHAGTIDEERFRTLRLARGVYGQRQTGVQMVRIKIPYGKLNARQLNRIADVSDKFSTGKLHITTRQDIQIHHVSLDRTPELWEELEKDAITLREACGNTVRNITASSLSGIDNSEAFDVRPYADAVFKYFLRNPICQEMGRKIKIAFSNSSADTALTFMHDIGFIAELRNDAHGFKVLVAGGLGSQSRQADVLYDFLPAERIIPVTEAILRLFELNGERSNRMKARLKFWVRDIGIERFKALMEEELKSVPNMKIFIPFEEIIPDKPLLNDSFVLKSDDQFAFHQWKAANVFSQKQEGLYAIGVKVRLGDFSSVQARTLAEVVEKYSGNELTLTIDQNLIIRHVSENQLARFYDLLRKLELADHGFGTSQDITACPGTDTCNLGIANSTSLSKELEQVITHEYPHYQPDDRFSIKISGCMNSCGQHMIASIGFQGMSIRTRDKRVLPAVQVLLGGGNRGNGVGRFADKVIKIPGKRAPEALRWILNAFESSGLDDFLEYYDQHGERYFYDLLKPLANIDEVKEEEFIDWGQQELYKKEIGVGECAGVVIDLVSTLFKESEEKLELAQLALDANGYADAMYHAYSSVINTSKALLLSEKKRTNSHAAIIEQFQEVFVDSEELKIPLDFKELALRHKNVKASAQAAKTYLNDSITFYKSIVNYRAASIQDNELVKA